jgi:hypothetical protein
MGDAFYMNRKNIIPFVLSTLAGGLAALAVCAFFLFYYKPAPAGEKPRPVAEESTPTPTPKKQTESPPVSTQKVNLSEVNSVSINTVYTGFYDANSECGKSMNPSPKADDTISLSYSPCRTVLTFNRSGDAAKSLVVKRSDKSADEQEKEKAEWKSTITAEQFEALLKSLAGNKDFIEWPNVLIYHSNCTIYAYHKGGMLQVPLYIDIKRGSSMEPALNAFKELDKKVAWKKV